MYCTCIDLEKAKNRVPRDKVYECMRKKGVVEKTVKMVMEMQPARPVVRTTCGDRGVWGGSVPRGSVHSIPVCISEWMCWHQISKIKKGGSYCLLMTQ